MRILSKSEANEFSIFIELCFTTLYACVNKRSQKRTGATIPDFWKHTTKGTGIVRCLWSEPANYLGFTAQLPVLIGAATVGSIFSRNLEGYSRFLECGLTALLLNDRDAAPLLRFRTARFLRKAKTC